MPSSPRSVLDWYRDARLVLDQCEVEAERMSRAGAPIDGGHLAEAVRLSKQLVALVERPSTGPPA